MPDLTAPPAPLARRTLVGAAWAAPVIALAVSAPSAAASGTLPPLGARAEGPAEDVASASTAYRVYATNTGSAPLEGGSVIVVLQDPGSGYSFAGFNGQQWSYADGFPEGRIALRYDPALAAGEESGILLLLIASDDRTQSPVPVADLVITAPGFDVAVLSLTVPY
ncbi:MULTISPECIES: hypothetical protein [unclassified Rathayibacter]|uniref:hypothetical protein n=1 Tax=unclassified Rathayibacter TaxID=2609250 RepID=UPI000F4C1620|nr:MULTISPECIES: hypothetical protein [unclassified Rathayibacter]ROP56778.1 hypothetical protein EDF45_0299 [Rathayibacter sp. PhB186]ROS55163.1 hypothetical protein EDF44_0299 [Rathayibacter sp. PhB185]